MSSDASGVVATNARRSAELLLMAAIRTLAGARDAQAIAQVVTRTARALLGSDGATFVLREAEHCRYLDEDAIAPLWKGQRFALDACISGWVMLNQQQVAIEDVFADARTTPSTYQPTFVKSLAITPVAQQSVQAAIGVYWARSHRASQWELALLQDLADATAVAFENAAAYLELERRVERRTQELIAANRELETFSYSVAHDLRSPLTCIVGFADLLERRFSEGLEPKGREILQEIVRSGQTMSELIDGLLTLAQQGRPALHNEEVNLSVLAQRIADTLQQQTLHRVRLSIEPGLVAHGDSTLLEIVLHNLLANAFKYTGKTSEAEIRVLRAPGKEDAFVVQDNGAGFDPATAGRLFAPFQRLHPQSEFPGAGIGLAMVARIVRKHGGSVWAEATPGQGASFFFALPQQHS